MANSAAVKVLRGKYAGRTAEIVGSKETDHGQLLVVWFGGDEWTELLPDEISLLSN